MFNFLLKKQKLQSELVETINTEIWLLEKDLEKGFFKSLSIAEQNELRARLRVIKNNTVIIDLINK